MTLFIMEEEALSSASVNMSIMHFNNSFLLTSVQSCDSVQSLMFSYRLRLDSLCYALCSGADGERKVLELYKVRTSPCTLWGVPSLCDVLLSIFDMFHRPLG